MEISKEANVTRGPIYTQMKEVLLFEGIVNGADNAF